MILKSFILANLVSLYMKIINSAVVVGLYYGFLTTFSVGPSYLLLLRTWFLEEENEEGTEKRVSATTGFLMGQLVVFISTYYAPLHLALGRSHTITFLALAHFAFHFYWNSNEDSFYLDDVKTPRNPVRNFAIQGIFLNNFISPLLNHWIFPSSTAARLANIYMFRCNNKILFVTSSFVAWLIGYILFIKWLGFLLVWIQENNPLRFRRTVFVRFIPKDALWVELRIYMDRAFTILLFFIVLQSYEIRKPFPWFAQKNKQKEALIVEEQALEAERAQLETEEEEDDSSPYDAKGLIYDVIKGDNIIDEEAILVNGKKKIKDQFNFHLKETFYKRRPVYETFDLDGNRENWKFEIQETDLFGLEEPLATMLFDFQYRSRPFQAVKENRLTVHLRDPIQNRMSEFSFHTCTTDGKERISFTYPSTLSTFLEMLQSKISLFTTEKPTSTELYNRWESNNEQRKKTLSNEFINRVKNLDKGFPILNVLEKRTRLYNPKEIGKYLSKKWDPLLSGPSRGKIRPRTYGGQRGFGGRSYARAPRLNKIFLILLTTNYQEFDYQEFDQEFEQKIDTFNRKSFSIKISYFFDLVNEFAFNLINEFEFAGKSLFPDHKEEKIDLEDRIQILDSLFTKLILDIRKTQVRNKDNIISYEPREIEIRNPPAYPWLRGSRRVDVFINNDDDQAAFTAGILRENQPISVLEYPDTLLYYSGRRIPKNTKLAKRRKSSLYPLYQVHLHSLLFLERTEDLLAFLFASFNYISERIKMVFLAPFLTPKVVVQILGLTYTEKNTTENKTKERERLEKKEEAIKRRQIKEEEMEYREVARELAEEMAEDYRLTAIEEWESEWLNQISRTFILLFQSHFRKSILIPALIIAKNIIRILLFQTPEWSEDFQYWKNETHLLCTYDGTPVSETELPKEWLDVGLQIKILFPFRLRPWHSPKFKQKFLQKHKDQIKKKNQLQKKIEKEKLKKQKQMEKLKKKEKMEKLKKQNLLKKQKEMEKLKMKDISRKIKEMKKLKKKKEMEKLKKKIEKEKLKKKKQMEKLKKKNLLKKKKEKEKLKKQKEKEKKEIEKLKKKEKMEKLKKQNLLKKQKEMEKLKMKDILRKIKEMKKLKKKKEMEKLKKKIEKEKKKKQKQKDKLQKKKDKEKKKKQKQMDKLQKKKDKENLKKQKQKEKKEIEKLKNILTKNRETERKEMENLKTQFENKKKETNANYEQSLKNLDYVRKNWRYIEAIRTKTKKPRPPLNYEFHYRAEKNYLKTKLRSRRENDFLQNEKEIRKLKNKLQIEKDTEELERLLRNQSKIDRLLNPRRFKKKEEMEAAFALSKRRDAYDSCFLTVVGLETHVPFGPPNSRLPLLQKGFAEKVLKKLKNKIRKWKKRSSIAIKRFLEKRNVFRKFSEKRRKSAFIESIFFLNRIKPKFSKPRKNPKSQIGFLEGYELNETKTKKDLKIKNLAIDKISTPTDLVNHFGTKAERTLKNLSKKTKVIRNEIKKWKTKEEKQKEKGFRNSERNISPNKLRYNIQKFKSILHILKKKTVRLIRKSDSFLKIWIEKIWIEGIYIDRLFNITKIVRIPIQKYIYNNKENKKEKNQKIEKTNQKIEKTNQKIEKTNQKKKKMHFISFLEKVKISNSNFKMFYDVTSLSQAYVFYKLAKVQTSNFDKNEMKNVLEGFFPSKLKDINFRDSVMNQWKNWLRSHYPYKSNFFQINWSELMLKKWRNRVNQQRTVQNKDLNKSNSNEFDLLWKVKDNYKKHNRYNLLSHKSINYRGDKEKIGFNYKTDKMKREFFHILRGTPSIGVPNSNFNNYRELEAFRESLESDDGILDSIELKDILNSIESEGIPYSREEDDAPDYMEAGVNHRNWIDLLELELMGFDYYDYLEMDPLFDMEKSPKRKYFDWRIFNFSRRNKEEIEFWINISKNKHNTEIESKIFKSKYKIVEKESDQEPFGDKYLYLPTLVEKDPDFLEEHPLELDWMGMNEEILDCLVSNWELRGFFPKFEKLYNAYRRRPWVIPIQLLLLNYNESRFRESVNMKSILRIDQKNKDFVGGNLMLGNSKQLRPSELEENQERVTWGFQTYNYLLKANTIYQKTKEGQKGWIKSLIRRRELSPELWPINRKANVTAVYHQLIPEGKLTIELPRGPQPESRRRIIDGTSKRSEKLLMYQTIATLLVHKTKQYINQGSGEKSDINKENYCKSIERLESLIRFRNKKDFLVPANFLSSRSCRKLRILMSFNSKKKFLVPENLLSSRSRRKLRILMSFNSKKENDIHMNTELFKSNNIKNSSRFNIIEKSKYFDREKKKLLQFKLFLWPNFRFEDLACMNRFWFNTNNGSRFSMLRIRIYPQLKIK
uniref:Protein TIC 214 n=1 Tax=Passiflora contracta TaxID=1249011 RepID=A0A7G9IXR2_9ROSI|nr:Ycf1 [Passiflora contracta]QNM40168.1 Ycf1 [Passiflora contracta]